MELVDFVITTLIGVAWLTRKVATLSFKAARFVARWLVSRNATRVPEPIVRTAATSSSPATGTAPKTGSTAAAAGARAPSESRFEIADRILHVKFGGGWSVTVRVYAKRGEAERQLRCCEPKMAEQLRYTYLRAVFPLKTVSLKAHSLEEVLRDCEIAGAELAADLLRRLGDPQLQPLMAREEASPVEVAPVEEAPVAEARPIDELKPQPKATPRPSPGAGKRVQGRVVEAGKRPLLSGNGFSYEVVLETEGGQEVKRGWHLSELFTQLNVAVGDNVAITDLGRKQVEPGTDGQKRFKTVYDVERV